MIYDLRPWNLLSTAVDKLSAWFGNGAILSMTRLTFASTHVQVHIDTAKGVACESKKNEPSNTNGAGESEGGRPSRIVGGCRAAERLRGKAVCAVLWECPARDRRKLVP